MGTVEDGERFFGGLWPEARAVSDHAKFFYEGFGRGRGGLLELFGPSVWVRGALAALKGNGLGMPVGDPLVMPGSYLVRDESIVWRHDATHAADHPDYARVPALLAEAKR